MSGWLCVLVACNPEGVLVVVNLHDCFGSCCHCRRNRNVPGARRHQQHTALNTSRYTCPMPRCRRHPLGRPIMHQVWVLSSCTAFSKQEHTAFVRVKAKVPEATAGPCFTKQWCSSTGVNNLGRQAVKADRNTGKHQHHGWEAAQQRRQHRWKTGWKTMWPPADDEHNEIAANETRCVVCG